MRARDFDYIGDKSRMKCMLPYEILQSLMSKSCGCGMGTFIPMTFAYSPPYFCDCIS